MTRYSRSRHAIHHTEPFACILLRLVISDKTLWIAVDSSSLAHIESQFLLLAGRQVPRSVRDEFDLFDGDQFDVFRRPVDFDEQLVQQCSQNGTDRWPQQRNPEPHVIVETEEKLVSES